MSSPTRTAVDRRVRGVAAARRRTGRRSWPTSATRASRPSSDRLRDWPGSIVAYALVDQAPQRLGGYARAIGERFATVSGPATTLLGRITGSDPGSTTLEIHGLDPLAGPITTRLSTAGRHNAANALAVAGAASAWPSRPTAIAAGLATFEGIGRRLERKGEAAGVVVYDDYGHHPTAIRETLAAVRQREPGRPRLGRLRAADLPSDGGDARRLRRCPVRRGRGGDRRHLGRSRPRHHHRHGGRRWPRRSPPGSPG